MEEWKDIEGFPGYGVSSWGRVTNDKSGRTMVQSRNQQGIYSVGLMLEGDGRQYRRSIAVLVAKAFLPDPPPHWDNPTPIHLDGNRDHTFAENLLWRPRWFAVKYHQQFDTELFKTTKGSVEIIETGERFDNLRHAATTHGLLVKEILLDITNQNGVFPYGQCFRFSTF